MSSEKVERYKEQKANREAQKKKKRRNSIIRNSIWILVLAFVAVYLGISGFNYYKANKPRKEVEVDYDKLDDYVSGLEEDTAEGDSGDEAADGETSEADSGDGSAGEETAQSDKAGE